MKNLWNALVALVVRLKMAKLTSKQRKSMPEKEFAVVEKEGGKTRKRFPINDKAHARNALARLNQAKGLSKMEKTTIKRKAYAKLGKKPKD